MKTLLIGFMMIAAPLVMADDSRLVIHPQRRSLHVGETVTCQVRMAIRGADPFGIPKDWNVWGRMEPFELTFPYVPKVAGTNLLGPIEFRVGETFLSAPAVRMLVLPDPGTNSYFEIRAFDTQIQRSDYVEGASGICVGNCAG